MKKALLFVAALTAMAGTAFAQAKFASVDMQRASQGYWKVSAEMSKFEGEQQRLDDLRKDIQTQIDQLVQEREQALQETENPAYSADRQATAKETVKAKEQEINARRRSFDGEVQRLQARAQESQRQIEQDVRNAVQVVGKRDGYDIVFPSQVALYAGNDITDKVIAELNRTQPAGTK